MAENEKHLYPERGITVAERFARLDSTPEKVCKFTAQFGPLAESPGRGKFSFEIDAWRAARIKLMPEDVSEMSGRQLEDLPDGMFQETPTVAKEHENSE
jgi:hypothetical protein